MVTHLNQIEWRVITYTDMCIPISHVGIIIIFNIKFLSNIYLKNSLVRSDYIEDLKLYIIICIYDDT